MITPVPVRSVLFEPVTRLIETVWSQWLNGLRNAVNATPGNTVPVLAVNLPQAVVGQLAVVTDSTVNTWGTTVVGGGAFTVATMWNGTHWTVIGK